MLPPDPTTAITRPFDRRAAIAAAADRRAAIAAGDHRAAYAPHAAADRTTPSERVSLQDLAARRDDGDTGLDLLARGQLVDDLDASLGGDRRANLAPDLDPGRLDRDASLGGGLGANASGLDGSVDVGFDAILDADDLTFDATRTVRRPGRPAAKPDLGRLVTRRRTLRAKATVDDRVTSLEAPRPLPPDPAGPDVPGGPPAAPPDPARRPDRRPDRRRAGHAPPPRAGRPLQATARLAGRRRSDHPARALRLPRPPPPRPVRRRRPQPAALLVGPLAMATTDIPARRVRRRSRSRRWTSSPRCAAGAARCSRWCGRRTTRCTSSSCCAETTSTPTTSRAGWAASRPGPVEPASGCTRRRRRLPGRHLAARGPGRRGHARQRPGRRAARPLPDGAVVLAAAPPRLRAPTPAQPRHRRARHRLHPRRGGPRPHHRTGTSLLVSFHVKHAHA
jgi:hypothetical protein